LSDVIKTAKDVKTVGAPSPTKETWSGTWHLPFVTSKRQPKTTKMTLKCNKMTWNDDFSALNNELNTLGS
jgi:hypothetical protein